MRNEVTVKYDSQPPVCLDINEVQPMPHDVARQWLDEQFSLIGCASLPTPVRPSITDKVLAVALGAGPQHCSDPAWGQTFARATSAMLGKPVVHIDVPAWQIAY
jgi:hypothetical protein